MVDATNDRMFHRASSAKDIWREGDLLNARGERLVIQEVAMPDPTNGPTTTTTIPDAQRPQNFGSRITRAHVEARLLTKRQVEAKLKRKRKVKTK